MTIAQLDTIASEVMASSLRALREDGSLRQSFLLVKPGGGLDIIVFDAATTNNEAAKAQFSRDLKARVKAERIEAVMMVSDAFVTENMSAEVSKIRRALGLTIKQAGLLGICEVYEAVMLMVETPIYRLHMQQNYRHEGARIELVGELKIERSPDVRALMSRFTGFFDSTDTPAGAAS